MQYIKSWNVQKSLLPHPSSGRGDLVLPLSEIQLIEFVAPDHAVLVPVVQSEASACQDQADRQRCHAPHLLRRITSRLLRCPVPSSTEFQKITTEISRTQSRDSLHYTAGDAVVVFSPLTVYLTQWTRTPPNFHSRMAFFRFSAYFSET